MSIILASQDLILIYYDCVDNVNVLMVLLN